MLKYCDSFDHATIDALWPLGWWANDSWSGKTIALLTGSGRWGTNRLQFGVSSGSAPYFQLTRSATRLVIGFAFQQVQGNSSGDQFAVTFGYGALNHFRICGTTSPSGITFSFRTGTSGYPAIPDSAYVSVPFLRQAGAYTFVELLIDAADFMNGIVKVAVNGRLVHTITGVETLDGNAFGNNPYDVRAKLNRLSFCRALSGGNAEQPMYNYVDTMYICDDEGGYHNDFLGDVVIRSLYPKSDGDQRVWTPFINGLQAPDETPRVAQIDDAVFNPSVEPDYIQADQDLSQETMLFAPSGIPVDSTLIAVNHRTAARSVASPGNPPQNTLIPLFKSSGNDILVTNSLAKKFTGWSYQFLDIYYNLVPGFAIDWTDLLLNESQFGIMLRESIWTGFADEGVVFSDDVVDTEFDWDLVEEALDFLDEVTEEIVPEVTESPLDFTDEVVDT